MICQASRPWVPSWLPRCASLLATFGLALGPLWTNLYHHTCSSPHQRPSKTPVTGNTSQWSTSFLCLRLDQVIVAILNSRFFFFRNLLILFLCIYMFCVYVYMSARWLWRLEEGFRLPGTGVTGDYESQTLVLWKNIKSFNRWAISSPLEVVWLTALCKAI